MIFNDDDDIKITERPSSRGGIAFDIVFDGSSVPQEMPIGLKNKTQKVSNLTKDDLTAKLRAVDQRRKVNYNNLVDFIMFYHCRLWRKNAIKS